MSTWHSLTLGEAAARLGTDRHRGLSKAEAQKRLQKYGPNRLEGKPPRPLILRLSFFKPDLHVSDPP